MKPRGMSPIDHALMVEKARQADATLLLAKAVGAAIGADGWSGDPGPAIKAATVSVLRHEGNDEMADLIEQQPCHVWIEGRS